MDASEFVALINSVTDADATVSGSPTSVGSVTIASIDRFPSSTEYFNVSSFSTLHPDAIGNITSDYEEPLFYRHSPVWSVVLCVAYLIVFFLGLIGNSSVLWVIFVLRKSSRHSMFSNCNKVFNGLIGNLALADLLVIIFCLPATLLSNIIHPWILGRFVCKFVQYCQGVSVSASVYTLVAISIDRFYGIYYPFANGFSTLVRRSVIIFIWVLSFSITIPWLLYFDIVRHGELVMCQEVWPSEQKQILYFLVVNLGLQYLVPLSIILIFYILLLAKIWRRKIPVFHTVCRREMSTDTVDQWNARIVEHSKMKVLKMLIVIVSLFALSWLPLYILFLWVRLNSYEENSLSERIVIIASPLAQWLGASNSCVNPILYFFFNAKFRTYLKKAITRSLLCSSSVEYTRNHVWHQQFAPTANQNRKCQNGHHNIQTANNQFQYPSPHHRPGTPSTAHTASAGPIAGSGGGGVGGVGGGRPIFKIATIATGNGTVKKAPLICALPTNDEQHLLRVHHSISPNRSATLGRVSALFDEANSTLHIRSGLLCMDPSTTTDGAPGDAISSVNNVQQLNSCNSPSPSGSWFLAGSAGDSVNSTPSSRSMTPSPTPVVVSMVSPLSQHDQSLSPSAISAVSSSSSCDSTTIECCRPSNSENSATSNGVVPLLFVTLETPNSDATVDKQTSIIVSVTTGSDQQQQQQQQEQSQCLRSRYFPLINQSPDRQMCRIIGRECVARRRHRLRQRTWQPRRWRSHSSNKKHHRQDKLSQQSHQQQQQQQQEHKRQQQRTKHLLSVTPARRHCRRQCSQFKHSQLSEVHKPLRLQRIRSCHWRHHNRHQVPKLAGHRSKVSQQYQSPKNVPTTVTLCESSTREVMNADRPSVTPTLLEHLPAAISTLSASSAVSQTTPQHLHKNRYRASYQRHLIRLNPSPTMTLRQTSCETPV